MRGERRRVRASAMAGWRGQVLVAALAVSAMAAGGGVIAMSRPEPGRDARLSSLARPAVGCADAATMSLRDALAQTLMVGVTAPTRNELTLLAGVGIGGLFLHGNGTRELTDGRLRRLSAAAVRPLVSADDEGGRVQRIAALAGSMRSAQQQARTLKPAQVRKLASRRGAKLLTYGITMDLAPVVDLGTSNPAIGDRSYSGKPTRVATYAGAFAAGLRDAGVLATLKHFPGHGRAVGDSHRGQATTPPVDSLRARDWVPYRALRGSGAAVMVGHLTVPGLSTPGLPSSLDPKVYRALRREIGFSGLVVTDELSDMKAVRDRFGLHQAVRRAIAAGADLALFFADPARVPRLMKQLDADLRHGRLSPARVRNAAARVLAVKGCG